MGLDSYDRICIRRHLTEGEALPPALAQRVLVELELAGGMSGKKSLSYTDALDKRNALLTAAFEALPGKAWSRCNELARRIAFQRYGDDEAGQYLKEAVDTRCKMPQSIRQLHNICCAN